MHNVYVSTISVVVLAYAVVVVTTFVSVVVTTGSTVCVVAQTTVTPIVVSSRFSFDQRQTLSSQARYQRQRNVVTSTVFVLSSWIVLVTPGAVTVSVFVPEA